MRDVGPRIESLLPELIALRRQIHADPELGYEENRTAARIVERLRQIPELDLRTGVAGTGIIATLGADKPGPMVALRAEMDALPIVEESGKPHASKTHGVMHACGHDGHSTAVVGAAAILAEIGDELPGPVRFVFQPAEETGAGGRAMCEAGALDGVAAAFALHCWTSLFVGTVAVLDGPTMASSDTFEITVRGRASHAGYPHLSVDAPVIASHVVVGLQAIVSRQIDPLAGAVVSVTQIHGGNSTNTIPDTVKIVGTIRTLSEEARATAKSSMQAIATSIAGAYGGEADVDIAPGYPVTVNDSSLAAHVRQTAAAVLPDGEAALVVGEEPSMACEDFSFYGAYCPTAFWWLGIRPPSEPRGPVCHHPEFDFNDAALPVAIRMHVELVRRFRG